MYGKVHAIRSIASTRLGGQHTGRGGTYLKCIIGHRRLAVSGPLLLFLHECLYYCRIVRPATLEAMCGGRDSVRERNIEVPSAQLMPEYRKNTVQDHQ